jgi:hypothetical protein
MHSRWLSWALRLLACALLALGAQPTVDAYVSSAVRAFPAHLQQLVKLRAQPGSHCLHAAGLLQGRHICTCMRAPGAGFLLDQRLPAFALCVTAARYNVDPQLARRALSRVCLPDIVEAQGPGGIKAFAEWPVWFERRS